MDSSTAKVVVDTLPQNIANQRGGQGAMCTLNSNVQLWSMLMVDPGECDVRGHEEASLDHVWFVHTDDGSPTAELLRDVTENAGLSEEHLAPRSTRKERYAKRIQRAWRNVISNPNYAVCRKRLMSEFREIENYRQNTSSV